jgi:uncharacterized membrane protein
LASSGGVDGQTRRLVVFLLRAGLVGGCLLMAIGLALALFEGRLRSHPVAIADLARFMVSGRPSGFMAAGVVVLVMAPLARVVALAAEFVREGDRRFGVIALSVAAILVFGVLAGRA